MRPLTPAAALRQLAQQAGVEIEFKSEQSGPSHTPTHTVTLYLDGLRTTARESAATKKEAEHVASFKALHKLQKYALTRKDPRGYNSEDDEMDMHKEPEAVWLISFADEEVGAAHLHRYRCSALINSTHLCKGEEMHKLKHAQKSAAQHVLIMLRDMLACQDDDDTASLASVSTTTTCPACHSTFICNNHANSNTSHEHNQPAKHVSSLQYTSELGPAPSQAAEEEVSSLSVASNSHFVADPNEVESRLRGIQVS
eukprot:jgi/Chlat1/4988/Chrsp32S04932